MKKYISLFLLLTLLGCVKNSSSSELSLLESTSESVSSLTEEDLFTYDSVTYTPNLGAGIYNGGPNESVTNFNDVIINPITGARNDFIKGVEASTIDQLEKAGGKYYNSDGVQQDIFQILADHGVNFFKIRIWNKPRTVTMQEYGGGSVDVKKAIVLAKRARAVGMNIYLDFHLSDIWADNEEQITPRDWASLELSELPDAVYTYLKTSLESFKKDNIKVDIIQVGNSINNGIFFDKGGKIDWSNKTKEEESFAFIRDVLNKGFQASKEVYPNSLRAIQLTNGGTLSEFDTYFTYLQGVDYNIIGASYYSYYDGDNSGLLNVLNTCAEKFNKYVLIAETSYAHSDVQEHALTQNEYTADVFEDKGGYVTSTQGQASAIADVLQTVANVNNHRGLGAFYFEPAWLPITGASYDLSGLRTTEKYELSQWANQGLFSYYGKVLPSISVFQKVNSTSTVVTEEITGIKYANLNFVLNKAENESLPSTLPLVSSQDRFILRPVVWNAGEVAALENLGKNYVVHGVADGKFDVIATVDVIENFVRDASYENQSETIALPWSVTYTPTSSIIAKVERKNNTHSGKANLNWWHNEAFTVNHYQDISGLDNGNYRLSLWIQGEESGKGPYTSLYMYVENYGGERLIVPIELTGWMKWKTPVIEFTVTTGISRVGIYAASDVETWAHVDDWQLVKI